MHGCVQEAGQGGNVVGYYETENEARAEADKRNASDHQ